MGCHRLFVPIARPFFMLTIFACPKPFRDPHICVIQRNAIRSWTLLKGNPEVILVGDEPGIAEICAEFGLRHVKKVICNEKGTPRLDKVFQEVQSAARHSVLCYVNADIVLLDDFIDAARKTMTLKKALMVGARMDLDLSVPIDFSDSTWASRIHSEALTNGKPMTISSDYFLFRRGLYDSLPPFLVGRPAYDNWMIWYARSLGFAVVDASAEVLAVHQNHNHTVSWAAAHNQSENESNRNLAGRWHGTYNLRDANAYLSSTGVHRRRFSSVKERLRIARIMLRRYPRHLISRWRFQSDEAGS